MKIVEASQEFHALSQDDVMDALEDINPDNPIAVEISRLMDGYLSNFTEHVEKIGHIPPSILRSTGSCPIETVAMELVSDTIRATLEEEEDDV